MVRRSALFSVRTVRVEGNHHLTAERIRALSGIALGQSVFEVSPAEAQARLEQSPWVAQADVERRLPNTFVVQLTEHRPVLLLSLDQPYLVADDGMVFKQAGVDDPVDLPVLTGVDRARFTAERAYRTSVIADALGLLGDYRGSGLSAAEPVDEVHVESTGGLSIYIGSDAMFVRLGRPPFLTKLRRLRTLLQHFASSDRRPAYVYLDSPSRPDRATVYLRPLPVRSASR